MSLRFTLQAATRLRRAIRDADGVEVFAIGEVEGGTVTGVTITCRGQADRVTALLDRPRAGQVVIHNHPSGDLTPSDADMQLAGMYGENGVGMVIVDSEVLRSNWVVEPHSPKAVAVDQGALERFFTEALPKAMPDFEPRPGQIDMAREVARALSDGQPFVVEAGTGTGKSLAYLVPAAMWALANDAKVVVSTHTKALQAQLLSSDLPLLAKGGLQARAAVLQGRNNYVCKRRLAIARAEDEDLPREHRGELDAVSQWEQTTADGSRADLPLGLEPLLWERIGSDSDLTLRERCEHFATCHFYQARRRAAAAHLVVVNHALLVADLSLRDAGVKAGILPKYGRLILDEAHHIEDAATGATEERVTARAIDRAVFATLSRKGRPGALDRLFARHGAAGSALPSDKREALGPAIHVAAGHLATIKGETAAALAIIAAEGLDADRHPLRITADIEKQERWIDLLAPPIGELARTLQDAAGALDAVVSLFADARLPEKDAQPLLDVQRTYRRLAGHAAVARKFLEHSEDYCRWLEATRGRDAGGVALNIAPIEVGPLLNRILWSPIPGAVATSATLAVGGRFDFWLKRSGLGESASAILPSPFDHANQALLALPRDLPAPDDPSFLAETAAVLRDAVRISDGGAFVLCTSYAAVRFYAAALREGLPPEQPVLTQDATTSRGHLLDRFRDNRRAILVGTDSFWEGVSVKGEGLRLVVIPRLPFRVPTEPLRVARHERILHRGGDPFRTFALPEAAIKLKQGYGRLIRHRQDRGVVLLLDRRVHERSYGQILLQSLPPARRISAPWQRIRDELVAFYGGQERPEVKSDVQAFLNALPPKR